MLAHSRACSAYCIALPSLRNSPMSQLPFRPVPRFVPRVRWCAALLLVAVGSQGGHFARAGEGIASAAKKQATTHRQASVISITSGQLKAFCLAPDGRILAVVHGNTS